MMRLAAAVTILACTLCIHASAIQSEALDKRESWNDGVGPVDLDTFSIIFNDRALGDGNVGDVLTKRFIIRGQGWEHRDVLRCDNNGDGWENFYTPLPWVVVIHGGNACSQQWTSGIAYDNTWIKYSSLFLNTPTSTICGRIWGEAAEAMRCLIPNNP